MADDDFGFAPPPFQPEAALVGLRRSLRDLGLAERGAGFELRGKRVLELAADSATIRQSRSSGPTTALPYATISADSCWRAK